jgi:cytochrome c oxidase cbb3-type subunit 3
MRGIYILAAAMVAAVSVGCNRGTTDLAVTGGAPAIDAVAIGPIPGPVEQETELSNPYSDDRVALAEGRKLFVSYNCYGCHGGRGGGGMGPSLRDEVWLYGDSASHIFDSISRGRGRGMPAWGKKIPQQQIWILAAYLKSLRTPLEPEPPQP